FFSSRRRHTRFSRDWSSDVCSSDLITAMSYAVPHVGLKVEKLSAYLGTWGVEGNKDAVEFSGLSARFHTATAISKEELEESRDRQFTEIRKAFDVMVEAITSKAE